MLTAITRYYQDRRQQRHALQTAGRYLEQVEEVLGEATASGPEQAVETARRLVALTHRFPETADANLPQLKPLRKVLKHTAPAGIDHSAVHRTLLATARQWPSVRPTFQRDLARHYSNGGWVVAFPAARRQQAA